MSTASTPLLGSAHYRNARQALQKRVELMRDREALMKKVREFDAAINAIDDVVIAQVRTRFGLQRGLDMRVVATVQRLPEQGVRLQRRRAAWRDCWRRRRLQRIRMNHRQARDHSAGGGQHQWKMACTC